MEMWYEKQELELFVSFGTTVRSRVLFVSFILKNKHLNSLFLLPQKKKKKNHYFYISFGAKTLNFSF